MFDALEKTWQNTEQADLINQLYQGRMKDCVQCLQVTIICTAPLSTSLLLPSATQNCFLYQHCKCKCQSYKLVSVSYNFSE